MSQETNSTNGNPMNKVDKAYLKFLFLCVGLSFAGGLWVGSVFLK